MTLLINNKIAMRLRVGREEEGSAIGWVAGPTFGGRKKDDQRLPSRIEVLASNLILEKEGRRGYTLESWQRY